MIKYANKKKIASKKNSIAIIGGGYTGLTAAYRLSNLGYSVTIFEKNNCIGGLASGFTMDGLSLEKIWHFLYMTDSDILDLAKELNVKDKLTFHNSSVSTYYDGKLYPFMTPLDLLKFTPLSFINRIRTGAVGLYLQFLKNWKPLTQITAYEWMTKMAGKQAVKIIWKPLLEGKFGKYYNRVTMSWLWGRIKVRVDSKEKTGEKLGYFMGGFGVLTDELERRIKEKSTEVITGVEISKITKSKNNKVIVEYNGEYKTFDRVIATTPSNVFTEITAHNKEMTEGQVKALNSIDYVGAVIMVFTSNQKISPYYWHNINDPEIPFLVLLANSELAGKETYKNKNVYYVGFYAEHNHRYFSEKDEMIMQEWEGGLKRMFPDFKVDNIREKKLFKFKNAQHIVDIGYEDKIPPYESVLKNVYLANFSQIYPEDRGLNYAVREGNKIAKIVSDSFAK